MREFAALYAELDGSTSTLHKVASLARYLEHAPPADAAWAVYFLAGGKPRQAVPARVLREAARRAAGIPEWLFEESYQAVGDLAETIAHLLPPPALEDDAGLDIWMRERLLPLRGLPPDATIARLEDAWRRLDARGRFAMNKLITGAFRVGVSRLIVIRALAQAFGVDARLLAQRIIGYTSSQRAPDEARFRALVAPTPARRVVGPADGAHGDAARPEGAPADAHARVAPADADAHAHVAPADAHARVARVDAHAEAVPSEADRLHDDERLGHPYPFFLAQSLEAPVQALGDRAQWLVEWKWDGIRAQLVRRGTHTCLWSRGEELISDRFPEIVRAAESLPEGTVLDGEVLAWDAASARPLPFASLQQRIGRRNVTAKALREAPAALRCFDLLEHAGRDVRERPLAERRALLEALVARHHASGGDDTLGLSSVVAAPDWPALAALREESRRRGVEGFVLKRLDSAYGVGRTKSSALGEWWKWKVDPLTIDAVLVYAQRGHGRRASLYTDYTFAVWDDDPQQPGARRLVPFAKAYSGLTDEEIRRVDERIRRTTVEKFGPVRSVTPTLVFELGFEGIQRSPRHRAGIAVRFPRILRWRLDKPVEEADTLAQLRALLHEG